MMPSNMCMSKSALEPISLSLETVRAGLLLQPCVLPCLVLLFFFSFFFSGRCSPLPSVMRILSKMLFNFRKAVDALCATDSGG